MKLGDSILMENYKTGDMETEKHVPFIEETSYGYRVTIGKNAIHPMDPDHYVEYIKLYVDGVLVGIKHFTHTNQAAIAEFNAKKGKEVRATELCTVHGEWVGEL